MTSAAEAGFKAKPLPQRGSAAPPKSWGKPEFFRSHQSRAFPKPAFEATPGDDARVASLLDRFGGDALGDEGLDHVSGFDVAVVRD
jgi:hypothetical protein